MNKVIILFLSLIILANCQTRPILDGVWSYCDNGKYYEFHFFGNERMEYNNLLEINDGFNQIHSFYHFAEDSIFFTPLDKPDFLPGNKMQIEFINKYSFVLNGKDRFVKQKLNIFNPYEQEDGSSFTDFVNRFKLRAKKCSN
uniref:hypothetical protein n=1 Tax=Fulvivirga sp. TaxID=1931237 RepID=UPI00404B2BB1